MEERQGAAASGLACQVMLLTKFRQSGLARFYPNDLDYARFTTWEAFHKEKEAPLGLTGAVTKKNKNCDYARSCPGVLIYIY